MNIVVCLKAALLCKYGLTLLVDEVKQHFDNIDVCNIKIQWSKTITLIHMYVCLQSL